MAWYSEYLESPEWRKWFLKETRKQCGGYTDDIESLCQDAMGELFEAFSKKEPTYTDSQAKLNAYVKTGFRRKLTDIHRSRHGRFRAPAPMIKAGGRIKKIFAEFCFDKREDTDIARRLELPLELVAEWTTWLRTNNKCPKSIVHFGIDDAGAGSDSENQGIQLPDTNPDPGLDTETAQLTEILQFLLQWSGKESDPGNVTPAMLSLLRQVRARLNLDANDRLLLQHRFQQDLSVPATAKILQQKVHTTRRREEALLKELAQTLSELGF